MPIVNGKPTMHSQAPGATTAGGSVSAVPPNVQQAVTQNGLAQTGQTPGDAAKQLLGNLKGQGFQAPPTASKDFATQLGASLRSFQQAQALPLGVNARRARATGRSSCSDGSSASGSGLS